jgi:hypothetical protein
MMNKNDKAEAWYPQCREGVHHRRYSCPQGQPGQKGDTGQDDWQT